MQNSRMSGCVLYDPQAQNISFISHADRITISRAPHQHPRETRFAEDLPKTVTGKIQRFKLRDPALGA